MHDLNLDIPEGITLQNHVENLVNLHKRVSATFNTLKKEEPKFLGYLFHSAAEVLLDNHEVGTGVNAPMLPMQVNNDILKTLCHVPAWRKILYRMNYTQKVDAGIPSPSNPYAKYAAFYWSVKIGGHMHEFDNLIEYFGKKDVIDLAEFFDVDFIGENPRTGRMQINQEALAKRLGPTGMMALFCLYHSVSVDEFYAFMTDQPFTYPEGSKVQSVLADVVSAKKEFVEEKPTLHFTQSEVYKKALGYLANNAKAIGKINIPDVDPSSFKNPCCEQPLFEKPFDKYS